VPTSSYLAEFKDFLLRLERSIRTSSLSVIAAGDFNAKSRTWGSPREDERGTLLADLMSALDMQACNMGSTPTFVRGTSEFIIDTTFASARIRGNVTNWRVLDDESLSLHKYITFDVGANIPTAETPHRGWTTRNLNKDVLAMALAAAPCPQRSSNDAEGEATQLVAWMTQAADSCMGKRRPGTGRPPVPWWSQDIGTLRSDCLKARRTFQRKRARLGDEGSQEHQERWKILRKSLAKAIKEAKEKSWAELIAMVDDDPWGKPYKVVMKRLRRHKPIPGIELPGRLESVVGALFPSVQNRTLEAMQIPDDVDTDPFSIEEILAAARSLPNNKAPGPDEVTNEIIKVAVSCDSHKFHRAMNNCLQGGRFPARWKHGKLVLIRKLGKPLDNPSAYRPICLLDGCGKLLEKLVVARLRDHLTGDLAIADNQYGFRRGRSTLDALGRLKSIVRSATPGHAYHHKLVGMLTLDVKNAFNSAPWEFILAAARAKRVPGGLQKMLESYLSERTIEVSTPTGGNTFAREMSCGVPQGSVLGPDLWNLLYDGLLKIDLPVGVDLIAFADDVAIISTASVPVLLEERLAETFNIISEWMSAHGLELAAEKTEAIVITRRRVHNEISVLCAGHTVKSQPSLRYLGVQIDKKLGFAEHADLVAGRAATAIRQLGFIMPNLRGPRQKSRRLLSCVATSRLLYAAPFWTDTMQARGWKKLAAVHRRSQLRVACCYNTVSYGAAAVVSGIPPIHLLAKERTDIHNGRSREEARGDLIENWSREWERCSEGRWTYKIIGDIGKWVSRKFGEVTFHTTQVLTGHGCFAAYLRRFHLQESDRCALCGYAPDDAEHVRLG